MHDKPTAQHRSENQALALAAVMQPCYLICKIARTGIHPQGAFDASINSLFVFDAASPADIYAAQDMMTGLRITLELLEDRALQQSNPEQIDIFRYSLSLMQLQQRLMKQSTRLQKLRHALEILTHRVIARSSGDPDILAELAGIYRELCDGVMKPIQVNGERSHLENPANINKIRALLLSGVRAVFLYRQLGGRRWHLLFSRTRLANATRSISAKI